MSLSLLERLQRNHAIEHASLHMLARHTGPVRAVACSDWGGFTIYGDIDTETLANVTVKALQALKEGHAELAIHPHCGSNFSISLLLGTLATALWLAMWHRGRWTRLLALGLIGGIVGMSKPLSYAVQGRLLTNPDVRHARIRSIQRYPWQGGTVHRITIAYE